VVAGPDGNVWLTYEFGIARITPDGSQLTRWPEPFGERSDCPTEPGAGPTSGLAFDAHGNLWAGDEQTRSIVRLASQPAAPAPLAPFVRRDPSMRPATMALAPDGGVWLGGPHTLTRVDAAGGRQVFSRGIGARPSALLPMRDGTVWFSTGRGLARLSPDGTVRRLTRGFGRRSAISSLALGPDGLVWFVDAGQRAVGRVMPSGRVRAFRRGFGRRSRLHAIAGGRDGRLWVTDRGGAIHRVTTSGRVRRFTAGLDGRGTHSITVGPDGNMWFTELGDSRVGRITARGRIRDWSFEARPVAIAAGPDGALWFTTRATADYQRSGVGRITVRGVRSHYTARTTCAVSPAGLVAGPDGKLWFLESHGPVAVARLDPARLAALGALPG
jgi:virginiamycin B lyase